MEGAEACEEAGVHLRHACDPYVVRLGELVRVIEPGVPGEMRERGGQGGGVRRRASEKEAEGEKSGWHGRGEIGEEK